ncbi:deoxycytidyl transferase [Haplosporangium sp. Z 27]|nr:deoxycytidyl transferase [Haplosporangium sp. Z 27]
MEREEKDDPYEAIQFGDFGTYIRHKKQKLQLQQEELAALASPDLPQIFEGIVVYVNGYTDPPIHGGEFRQYLSKSSTTHIIAENLTQAKMKEFRNYKVAKPAWITESVKANRLLPWHKFSTLRVPTSLSKLGDSAFSQSTMKPYTPNGLTNITTESSVINHESSITSSIDMLNDSWIALSEDNDGNLHELDDITELSQDRDPSVNFSGNDKNATSNIPLQEDEDEDLLFDDLELDQFEFLTPPNVGSNDSNNLNNPSSLPTEDHSRYPLNQDPTIQTSMDLEHLDVDSNMTVDQNNHPDISISEPCDINDAETNNNKGKNVVGNRHPTLIELSVPWNRLNSSVQPGFVEKFYQSSRLHYLSTWKIRLKEVTTEIQKDKVPTIYNNKNRIIMHVDFDCFFASVATRNKPELQEQPIAVAHGSGGSTSNSEIASCNYLARGFGVKNGMQLLKARALCPNLVVVPYEFQEYEDISIEFYKILLRYADELQAVSVDEALVDVTNKCSFPWHQKSDFTNIGQKQDQGPSRITPEALAEQVREEIFLATGCHASVGIAPNILLAKLATKRAKPHGQYVWPSAPGSEETIQEVSGPTSLPIDIDFDTSISTSDSNEGSQQDRLDPSPAKKSNAFKVFNVNDLPGVGYKIKQELQDRFSVRTLYELQQLDREELQRICGMKTGEMLYNSCRGIDDTTIASDREKARQSVSAEISWGVRFENQDQVDVFINDLAKEVSKRLKEIDRKGKSVVLKVMKRKEYVIGQWKHLGHGPVDQFARTGQLPMYTDDYNLIAKEARNLLQFFKFNVLDIRVSSSAFDAQDTMNQTTLSTTMFQRKPPNTITSNASELGKESLSGSVAPLLTSIEEPESTDEVFQGDVTLEIDSETFKELPAEIQEELSRHHRFVFINQDGRLATSSAFGGEVLHQQHEVNAGASSHHDERNRDQSPPPINSTLVPWSQLDPRELMALSTPVIRDTLKEYAGKRPNNHDKYSAIKIDDPQLETGILPSPSKAILQALPPDIRAEIEQEYTHIMENNELIRKLAQPKSSGNIDGASTSLSRPVLINNQVGNQGKGRGRGRGSTRGRPRGRGRGRERELLGRGTEHLATVNENVGDDQVIHETNLEKETPSEASHIPALDLEFLAALPPDIRAEVEAAHKIEALKIRQKKEIQTRSSREQTTNGRNDDHGRENRALAERTTSLERPALMGLYRLDEIRNMLDEWVKSTLLRDDENTTDAAGTSSTAIHCTGIYDEGPNPEDLVGCAEEYFSSSRAFSNEVIWRNI